MKDEAIVAVVGMPRSGTSMMMAMLAAGGLGVACDRECYGNSWETEKIFGLPHNYQWLDECRGRAVKILDPLQNAPPRPGYRYRFIWMSRNPHQQAQSQVRMLRAYGARVRRDFPRHRANLRTDELKSLDMLRQYDGDIEVVSFDAVLADPWQAARNLCSHLRMGLSAGPMQAVVHDRGPRASRQPIKLEHARRPGA